MNVAFVVHNFSASSHEGKHNKKVDDVNKRVVNKMSKKKKHMGHVRVMSMSTASKSKLSRGAINGARIMKREKFPSREKSMAREALLRDDQTNEVDVIQPSSPD